LPLSQQLVHCFYPHVVANPLQLMVLPHLQQLLPANFQHQVLV
jgi:hypothetical protein